MTFTVGDELSRKMVKEKWSDTDRSYLTEFLSKKIYEKWQEKAVRYSGDHFLNTTNPFLMETLNIGGVSSLLPQNFQYMIYTVSPKNNTDKYIYEINEYELESLFQNFVENYKENSNRLMDEFHYEISEYVDTQLIDEYWKENRRK